MKIQTTIVAFLVTLFIMPSMSCRFRGLEEKGTDTAARVVKVTDLGQLETNPSIRGRDGGYSGVFNNRSIWLYGDTVLEQADENEQTWHHNSWSWTADLDAADGISGFQERGDAAGAPREFFPLTPTEKAFNETHLMNSCAEAPCGARWALWPGAIIADAERDRALVFYSKIYAEPGDFNFHAVGYSIAVWREFKASPERPEFHHFPEYPTLLFGQYEPSFGSAALLADSMLYVYGRDPASVEKPIYVARVSLEHVLDRTAWRYYAGKENWAENLKDSKPVFDGNDMLSISYNDYLGAFLSIYSKPFGRDVVFRTAASPEGPWSTEVKIFQAREPTRTDGWIYDALAHPEYSRENGRLSYITYSRTTGFLESEVRLVGVELERSFGSKSFLKYEE